MAKRVKSVPITFYEIQQNQENYGKPNILPTTHTHLKTLEVRLIANHVSVLFSIERYWALSVIMLQYNTMYSIASLIHK